MINGLKVPALRPVAGVPVFLRNVCVRGLVAVPLILASGACAEVLGPEDVRPQPDTPFQTNTLQYTMADNAGSYYLVIPVTYVNRSAGIVYANRCDWVLEKRTGGTWTVTYAPICPAVGVPPLAYAPSTPHLIDFSLITAYAPNTAPRFTLSPIPGIYRFRIGLFARAIPTSGGMATLEDPLPLPKRVSNELWLGLP